MKSYSGGIRHDYKDTSVEAPAGPKRHWPWFFLGLLIPVATVSLLLVDESSEAPVSPPDGSSMRSPSLERALVVPDRPSDDFALPEDALQNLIGETLLLTVRSGDSLELLFRRNDLNLSDLASMAALSDAREHLRLLRPGDVIEIVHDDGRVLSLEKELDEIRLLKINLEDESFSAAITEREVDIRSVGAHGTIENSLFEAGVDAGISDLVTMNMAGIFQWDIDFIQDVRENDEFTVIYEELWREGVKLSDGEIVAAEYINRGAVYRAARFTDGSGRSDYFTPEGRSVRKAFIRAPVDFTRVSSNFNLGRRHPILNTIRAHRGVDYAAPSGTPVFAAGDGKIIFR
ncbi:MAG TPA: LysM-like peptidoglycan-binding domain-containing protein, partial [Gammaproteobacteria bacterium]